MLKTYLPIFALLRGSAFLLMANGLHGLLLPLRGQQEGFSNFALGLLGTGWAAGFIAGCFIAPRLVRKVGHVRAMSTFSAILGTIALLTGLIINEWVWIALRVMTGFAACGAIMVIESWLNETSTNETRGSVFSVYQMVTFLSIMIGQMAVAFSDVGDEKLFMVAGILYALALMPTAISTSSTPRPLLEAKLDIKSLYIHSPVAFVGCFMIGGANGAWGTLGPVLGIDLGLTPLLIAIMMSGTMIAGALFQLPVGKMSDKTDRRYVLGVASLLCAIAATVFFVIKPTSPTWIIGLTALYGAFAYTLYSVSVAHANDHATSGNFVTVSSGLLLLYGFGTMAGPILGSIAMDQFGARGIFLVTAFCHLIIAFYVGLRISRRAAPKDKTQFQAMPSERTMTTQMSQLDPRMPEEVETDKNTAQQKGPASK